MKDFSYVTHSHPSYIEAVYNDYLKDPETVDPDLKKFFEGCDFAYGKGGDVAPPGTNGQANVSGPVQPEGKIAFGTQLTAPEIIIKELGVFELIRAYRKRGHLISTTNPIRPRKDRNPHLELSEFGLSEADMESSFFAGQLIGLGKAKLSEILAKLKKIYAGNIGIQYTYMNRMEAHFWVQNRFEELMLRKFTLPEQKRILEKLNYGVIFEKFLNTKFIGQKRFGLEGGESMIPALDAMITTSADSGVKEVVIGMAH